MALQGKARLSLFRKGIEKVSAAHIIAVIIITFMPTLSALTNIPLTKMEV